VPFGVVSASDTRGRNVIVHEFPLKDSVYVEDMGRAKRTISLTAFLINPGFELKREALIAALEEPGPGTLIHPWLGSFYVNLTEQVEIGHSADSGGYASFKLTFVEAMEPEWPGFSIYWADLAGIRGLAARVEAALSFALDFVLSPVVETAMGIALEWATGLSNVLGAIYQSTVIFPFIADNVAGFFNQIVKLGGIAELMSTFWPVRDYRNEDGPSYAYKEATGMLNMALETPPVIVQENLGTMRRQVAENRAAFTNYQREMCGIAGLEAAAWAVPGSSREAKELKELALDAMDFLLNHATSDTAFRSIQSLGVATQRALAEAAKKAPTVVTIERTRRQAAFPIVWKEVLRDSQNGEPEAAVLELIRRNGIRHPGFTPAGPLEVLRA
jgi:prophage DNA circulation protein